MASAETLGGVIHDQEDDKHTATIIFLHGACGSAENLRQWVNMRLIPSNTLFQFPHIKVIYPDADEMPYTPANNYPCQIWFDWPGIHPSYPEDTEAIDRACQRIGHIIQQEIEQGIPIERIIIGGLSMGGVMTMHLAYRHYPRIPACFVLSSFLGSTSQVFKALDGSSCRPQLYMTHGDADKVIHHEFGVSTFQHLQNLGVDGQFHSYKGLGHDMNGKELESLMQWINSVLPK